MIITVDNSRLGCIIYRNNQTKIGLITDTNEEGIAKYQVEWKYDYSVDGQNVGFAYSCLTELPNHNIGLLYEKYDSYNPAELHSQDTIKYEELTLSDLMGAKAVRVTTAVSGNGSVSNLTVFKRVLTLSSVYSSKSFLSISKISASNSFLPISVSSGSFSKTAVKVISSAAVNVYVSSV